MLQCFWKYGTNDFFKKNKEKIMACRTYWRKRASFSKRNLKCKDNEVKLCGWGVYTVINSIFRSDSLLIYLCIPGAGLIPIVASSLCVEIQASQACGLRADPQTCKQIRASLFITDEYFH